MQDQRSGVVIHAKEQSIIATGNYKNSVEHKYSYCAIMYRLPAYGWSSTKDHIGVYFINPTTEYIGGGAEKMDLVCHMGGDHAGLLDLRPLCRRRGLQHPRRARTGRRSSGRSSSICNALENPKDPSQAELDTLGRHRRAIPPCRQRGMTMPSPCGTMPGQGQRGRGRVAL